MRVNIHDYSDIIDLPYTKSSRHKLMSRSDRAAQFAPFAALTNHKGMIEETERIVDSRKALSSDLQESINHTLSILYNSTMPIEVFVSYYIEDSFKEGGEYIQKNITIIKINEYDHTLITSEKEKIKIDDLLSIQII